jgi:hypothetical protein
MAYVPPSKVVVSSINPDFAIECTYNGHGIIFKDSCIILKRTIQLERKTLSAYEHASW